MNSILKSWLAASAVSLAMAAPAAESSIAFPGREAPGTAECPSFPEKGSYTLENRTLQAHWKISGSRLGMTHLQDKIAGKAIPVPEELFVLELRDGSEIKASDLKVLGISVAPLAAKEKASRLAERLPGKAILATLGTEDGRLQVEWKAILRDGSNYLRQEIAIQPVKGDCDIAKIVLVEQEMPGLQIVGAVPGSPVVSGNLFLGFEHPMSTSQVEDGGWFADPEAKCFLERALPLKEGKQFACSSVIGVVPEGQMRRGLLYYVERERAHPYRTFLHYNSWYDIGYFTPYNEADCLGVINAFAKELGEKRGVTMDSFLFDDGWDDTSKGGEWLFHKGFPNGFTPVKEAAAKVGASPGVWLSPWGGYGPPREKRVQTGKAAGYEAFGEGYETLFALSGPKYYANFHRACVEMVTKYGMNQFKLDGTGNINSVVEGSQFGSDFEAAIALIEDLRALKPDLYINLTTGTWPSPFWLGICDSIWRGGEDHFFKGVGSARQRWMTYRDGDTYQRVVTQGPLYPLNSLMVHGILYAKKAYKLDTDYENDFPSEVRSYFASGTQLQEMYVSHELLTEKNWDVLAEGAKWSRANAGTLVDTHWIGGDPFKLEVYGWASWSAEKGIFCLRNPSDEEQTFQVDLGKFFELPAGAPAAYQLKNPFAQRKMPALTEKPLRSGTAVEVTLRPFEVLVFEAIPEL